MTAHTTARRENVALTTRIGDESYLQMYRLMGVTHIGHYAGAGV